MPYHTTSYVHNDGAQHLILKGATYWLTLVCWRFPTPKYKFICLHFAIRVMRTFSLWAIKNFLKLDNSGTRLSILRGTVVCQARWFGYLCLFSYAVLWLYGIPGEMVEGFIQSIILPFIWRYWCYFNLWIPVITSKRHPHTLEYVSTYFLTTSTRVELPVILKEVGRGLLIAKLNNSHSSEELTKPIFYNQAIVRWCA